MSCTYRVESLSLTGDDVYGPRICNQPFVHYAWRGFGFNYDYWQNGWGFDDCCNIRKPLARALNAIWLLTYSAEDWRNTSWNGNILQWAPRYVREQFLRYDDLRAACPDGNAYARTTGCQRYRALTEWGCKETRNEVREVCKSWVPIPIIGDLVCWLVATIVEAVCVLYGWITTVFCTFWSGTVGDREHITLFLPFFYTPDGVPSSSDVILRASTLLHEARHIGERPHDADFPPGSAFGSGSGADSSWGYGGAWAYNATYLWWFYAQGARTTLALRQSARTYGNVILAHAFAQPTGLWIA